MLSIMRNIGAAATALITVITVSGPAGTVADPRRAEWRAGYRVPDAIPFPETNPYSQAKAELGRRLFVDPILSGARDRACLTCHQPGLGWADGRARAATLAGSNMDLRTPTILNVAWQDGPLGWDGKFRDLETVARTPIAAAGNMNLKLVDAVARLKADESYSAAFAAAFGDPAVSAERLDQALATFQRTIVAKRAPFDRWIAGDEAAIPETAKRGFDLFNGKAGCAQCHSGWSFTDNSFHDIGTAEGNDIGRGRLMPKSVALRYAFKTPTLRDVELRGPYMHDGALPDLAAVINLYDRGGIDRPSRAREIKVLHLAAEEKSDLLAFLATLTGEGESNALTAPLPVDAPKP
ncbi:cytochrome-c peroxidase [Methylobacterium aerolatum]|uniref:Cytochrome c peroxidase n=1 Tax=Methylobacterium aerolatum TaxID=418708 RepID=A0ABU0HXS1_9HYPH|nr:cytochrome c peroxidase [Methylobacterium aerolatum]MDQ0446667.1 cytochrome c peroxidase [Methylobacterium aerolatum]GJD33634.1 Cytochrome c551 peroxidase [Methylobacterium aerolatum]